MPRFDWQQSPEFFEEGDEWGDDQWKALEARYGTAVDVAGVDDWLDIHDPALAFATTVALPPPIKSVLIAGIIEMALLNSTHIVSMQNHHAQTSRWIPYEFGRAKERRSLATNAASWFQKGLTPTGTSDYLWLGFCARTSQALSSWLKAATGHKPPPIPNHRWQRPIPAPLPN